MNILLGVVLKIASTLAFAGMATMIKLVSDAYPTGEIVFCRSFFALIPVFIWVIARRRLSTVFRTGRIGGHAVRSLFGVAAMFFGFAALARLPLADATAIGYASPLLTVALAVVLLGETVRIYRWSAVIIGLLGVLVILTDYVVPAGADQPERSVEGAILQLAGAFCGAVATVQIRRLTSSEGAATIVVYFSGFSALIALVTLPFGWVVPTAGDAAILVTVGLFGGLGQVFMTQSFRYADASVLAPFDYISMIWAILIGLFLFDYVPTLTVLIGSAVVVGSGLFVIYRERQLGIERTRSKRAQPPPPPFT